MGNETLYTAFIETGKKGTGSYASSGSIPLPKDKVINYVKRNPIGNRNTKVRLENLSTKKVLFFPKSKFR